MLSSTLLAAATVALSALVAAQNATTPNGPCCTVAVNVVPRDDRSDWCRASQNTCPEICGGQSQLASGGNDCDDETLDYTCECRNGTKPDMNEYEQSVPGQMCRFWFDQCINATGDSLSEQFVCEKTRQERCGNKTTKPAKTSATSSGAPTATGQDGVSATTDGASAATSSGAAALGLARDFGTPVLAGGLMALFGFAL